MDQSKKCVYAVARKYRQTQLPKSGGSTPLWIHEEFAQFSRQGGKKECDWIVNQTDPTDIHQWITSQEASREDLTSLQWWDGIHLTQDRRKPHAFPTKVARGGILVMPKNESSALWAENLKTSIGITLFVVPRRQLGFWFKSFKESVAVFRNPSQMDLMKNNNCICIMTPEHWQTLDFKIIQVARLILAYLSIAQSKPFETCSQDIPLRWVCCETFVPQKTNQISHQRTFAAFRSHLYFLGILFPGHPASVMADTWHLAFIFLLPFLKWITANACWLSEASVWSSRKCQVKPIGIRFQTAEASLYNKIFMALQNTNYPVEFRFELLGRISHGLGLGIEEQECLELLSQPSLDSYFQLPLSSYPSDITSPCPICYEKMHYPTQLSTCQHVFGYECLLLWRAQNKDSLPTCPLCRGPFGVHQLQRVSSLTHPTQRLKQLFFDPQSGSHDPSSSSMTCFSSKIDGAAKILKRFLSEKKSKQELCVVMGTTQELTVLSQVMQEKGCLLQLPSKKRKDMKNETGRKVWGVSVETSLDDLLAMHPRHVLFLSVTRATLQLMQKIDSMHVIESRSFPATHTKFYCLYMLDTLEHLLLKNRDVWLGMEARTRCQYPFQRQSYREARID